jgi:hypothetical protein
LGARPPESIASEVRRCRLGGRRLSCPRHWLLSLLQSSQRQTSSARFWTGQKAACRKHFAEELGSSPRERYGEFVSTRQFLSEAWGVLGSHRGKPPALSPRAEHHDRRSDLRANFAHALYDLSCRGGEALIIGPVLAKVELYLQSMREPNLHLVKAVDTHMHADDITGLARCTIAPTATP